MHNIRDRIIHNTAFVTPVVGRKIAQWHKGTERAGGRNMGGNEGELGRTKAGSENDIYILRHLNYN